jgi:hypothetical protein
MERFEIQPVLGSSLAEVAKFIHNWHGERDRDLSIERTDRQDAETIEGHLRWLLIENPLAAADSQHGFSVCNGSGAMVGLILSFPGAFLAADQRLLGLCSGSFFVQPRARMQGFYLFKRYLSSFGYDFFFGTTCNANSGALWKKLGGCAVPNSETEYVLPLNLEVIFPAFLASKTSSELALEIARMLGRCTNPVLRLLTRKSVALSVEPCRDWEKLSELFRRHRSTCWITTDRSAAFLQWRYRQNSNRPSTIWLLRDKRGNEGWLSLGSIIRGRQGQIQGRVLLDAVWPREKMCFRDILSSVLQLVGCQADAIFFQPRPALDFAECSRWIIPRPLEGPQAFAMGRKGSAPFSVSSLDLVPADGDSAF